MNFTIDYTISSLKALNPSYSPLNGLRLADVQRINGLKRRIESECECASAPLVGDTVQLLDVYGTYYPKALILAIDKDGYADLREVPHVPFAFKSEDGKIIFSAGGSGCRTIHMSKLKYVGKIDRLFRDWGTIGVRDDGALYFEAQVNLWTYADDNRFHGDYSTKDWDREYFSFCANGYAQDLYKYRFIGNRNVFRTEQEYLSWLTTYKGVEFAGFSPSQTVVFYYKATEHLLSRDTWNALDLPTDTRRLNTGIQIIKYQYDDQSHVLHEYRYSNSGPLDDKYTPPYQAALTKVLDGTVVRNIRKPFSFIG